MIFRYANIAENKVYSLFVDSDVGLGSFWNLAMARCAFFDYAMLYGWIP
jgi:hypothetical protein